MSSHGIRVNTTTLFAWDLTPWKETMRWECQEVWGTDTRNFLSMKNLGASAIINSSRAAAICTTIMLYIGWYMSRWRGHSGFRRLLG